MQDQKERRGDQTIDDRGSTQSEGRELLNRLRDQGFQGSNQRLAVALGRPEQEVKGWMTGAEPVDDDVVMKARGIAKERNISIE